MQANVNFVLYFCTSAGNENGLTNPVLQRCGTSYGTRRLLLLVGGLFYNASVILLARIMISISAKLTSTTYMFTPAGCIYTRLGLSRENFVTEVTKLNLISYGAANALRGETTGFYSFKIFCFF